MTGTLKHAVGTAALPGSTFSGFTGTGMFETGTDILGFSTAGNERLRIDASGNVGIGTTSPFFTLDVQAANTDVTARVMNTDSTVARYPTVTVQDYMGAANAGQSAFNAYNSRGTFASPTALLTNDIVGGFGGFGEYDTAYHTYQVAQIMFAADQNLSTGNGGGSIRFSTTTNGATAPSEKMRISNAGNVGIGTATTSAKLTVGGTLGLNGATSGTTTIQASATASGTITVPAVTDTVAVLGTPNQAMSGGVNLTPYSYGTLSSGTTTLDCGKNPAQYFTNNGAFTLAAPANDGTCVILITNGASAGTIIFSGYTVGANTGDTLTTTSGNKFLLSVLRINGTSTYMIRALQ